MTIQLNEVKPGLFDIIESGKIVGGITFEQAGEENTHNYLERIDIDEQYRGHSIGTSALYAVKEMFGPFILSADNEDAARLYDRIGSPMKQHDYDSYGFAIDNGYGVFEI